MKSLSAFAISPCPCDFSSISSNVMKLNLSRVFSLAEITSSKSVVRRASINLGKGRAKLNLRPREIRETLFCSKANFCETF